MFQEPKHLVNFVAVKLVKHLPHIEIDCLQSLDEDPGLLQALRQQGAESGEAEEEGEDGLEDPLDNVSSTPHHAQPHRQHLPVLINRRYAGALVAQ